MSPYSQLLRAGADEVAKYLRDHESAISSDRQSYERLSNEMRFAASVEDASAVENSIRAIAHTIVDCFPLTDDFAPSFGTALQALQNTDRRRHKSGRSA